MSTSNYDHCSCGHNRQEHENFMNDCEQCECETFQRGMKTD